MVSSSKDTQARDAAARLLSVMHRMMASVRAQVRKSGQDSHFAHMRVLAILSHHGLTLGQLASALEVSAPTASRTVSHLEQRGLVSRTEDSADRRRVELTLTSAGRKEFRRMKDCAEAHVATVLASLDERDMGRLLAGIEALELAVGPESHDHDHCRSGPKGEK